MRLIHLLFAFQVIVLMFGKELSLVMRGKLSWFEAQKECQSQNSSLLVNLPNEININSSETIHIWRGDYRRTSAWIRLNGCYNDNVIEALSTTRYRIKGFLKGLFKSVGFCQEICFTFNKSVFALKDDLCSCLEHLPNEDPVSPLECNASCSVPGQRSEKPYFDECGGRVTYSLYISGTKDERRPNSTGAFCISIQCSETLNAFHLEESFCSQKYHPVCQLGGDRNVSGSWWKSMQNCKSMASSSYLMGDVYLDDINRTCDAIGREVTERSWLGIANELYLGYDRGIIIREEDKTSFVECQLCSFKNNIFQSCDYEACKTKLDSVIYCSQTTNQEITKDSTVRSKDILQSTTLLFGHQRGSTPTKSPTTITTEEATTSSTTTQKDGTLTTKEAKTLSTEAKKDGTITTKEATTPSTATQKDGTITTKETKKMSTATQKDGTLTTKAIKTPSTPTLKDGTLSTKDERRPSTEAKKDGTITTIEAETPSTTTEKNTAINSKEKNAEALPIAVSIIIAAGLAGVVFALVFIYLCFFKRKNQKIENEQKAKQEKPKGRTASNATGIVNYAYFTIELQEQEIKPCNLENKSESPCMEVDDDAYNYLRDNESRKVRKSDEYHYDSTKNVISNAENCENTNEGTYDRLGDKRSASDTDDTYHHAFSITKMSSGYDVTEIRKQYILDNPYNHVMQISPENSIEQDRRSNISEKENEDHTYFILEQN